MCFGWKRRFIPAADITRQVQTKAQVKRLEETLNANLNALAGSRKFEKTVTGLSAALQLLGARLGEPIAYQEVELTDKRAQNQAA